MPQSTFSKALVLLVQALFLGELAHYVEMYTCETPKEWLKAASFGLPSYENEENTQVYTNSSNDTSENGSGENANFRLIDFGGARKWPGGVVKYVLDSSLEENDIVTVNAAFREYHRKTCIRFQPRELGDANYTSIEITSDKSVCGRASVCMRGGYQYARFGHGYGCRFFDTMIHELGHTICLDHEQVRPDRDDWVSFNGCDSVRGKVGNLANPLSGIYDYSSQMHYDCNSCHGGFPKHSRVKKCGHQVTEGLSVLDADNINVMYDCQGCFRHRWKILQRLTAQDVKYMYSFGYTDIHGYSLFPCRAFFQGEIVIGKYTHQHRKCVVSWGEEEHEVFKNVEVLTIPGGVEQTISNVTGEEDAVVMHRYELASVRSISMQQVVKTGVPAGRTLDSDAGAYWEGVGYIAFGTIAMTDGDGESILEESIGTVWRRKWDDYPVASFAASGREHILADNFKVLVCNKIN